MLQTQMAVGMLQPQEVWPQEHTQETVLKHPQETTQATARTRETALETVPETALERTRETALETAPETALERTRETALETAPETALETALETPLETPLECTRETALERHHPAPPVAEGSS